MQTMFMQAAAAEKADRSGEITLIVNHLSVNQWPSGRLAEVGQGVRDPQKPTTGDTRVNAGPHGGAAQ
jgi:hypothetical protein